ncbi:MAG: LysM domain-containing protein [Burkholderiales bacterium]|nr:MAG: LysM domain-containing protein [Burkholderiales bacterium]
MAQSKAVFGHHSFTLPLWAALAIVAAATSPAMAQNYPITSNQRSTAEQVAQGGVPLSELSPTAPDSYTVKRGDTLWAISGLFLTSPWRWPELWGMNMQEVRNPHRIYPGQELVLDKSNGRAILRMRQSAGSGIPSDTIRVSPRTRFESLADSALPTLQSHLIEPFLAEPVIVEEGVLDRAPRIVAASDTRVLLTRGDRAYVRGSDGTLLQESVPGRTEAFRVFRSAKALRDPVTKTVLGYEAQYLGKASLVRGESVQQVRASSGEMVSTPVPATIDIVSAREEMRVGDRLLPEPPRQLVSYVPRAPIDLIDGNVVSMYGDAVGLAGQNQVVVINKGTAHGIESGHVLAILKSGAQLLDRTQASGRDRIKLPDERNGLLMVFRPFEKLSYALVLEITDGVQIGDRVANPR